MIRLSSENLSQSSANHLESVQTNINSGANFTEKADRAEKAWNGKESSSAKKAAFEEIKKKLIAMCVGVEICNYCENNEATDVEHIYPKSFFPERAFRWENYLLACKTCNSGHKLDKFAVFSPAGSHRAVELMRGVKPDTDDGLLIDPRTEDPLLFFWLDIQNKTFVLDPLLTLTPRDKERAEYTLKLLSLNNRTTLIEARKTAAKYYLDRLERYVRARDAQTIEELEAVVQDPDFINEAQPFEAEKRRVCQQIIKDIQAYGHPTVWYELKRQREKLVKTKRLIESAPEALNW